MEFIQHFSDEVDKLLASNNNIIHESNDSINIKIIETRETLINQLSAATSLLAKINAKIETTITLAKDNQAKDLAAARYLLTKLKNPAAKKIDSAKTYAGTAAAASDDLKILKSSINAPLRSAPTSKYTKIKFTEALFLNAIKISSFRDVKQDGELYYVDSADHFAIRLGGVLFHGNIGVIYTEEKNPEKIKDCKFASSCIKQNKCDYYHDPNKFSGSKDCRNFIASSWLYAPPDSLYKNRPRSRRFGSRDHLDIDIVGLQEEEINRFHDQMMHDLLCSLLLVQSYSQN